MLMFIQLVDDGALMYLESSEEGDDDDQFFEQEPPQDNREFMVKIWKGLKKTYKLGKGLHKKKSTSPRIKRSRSEGVGSSK